MNKKTYTLALLIIFFVIAPVASANWFTDLFYKKQSNQNLGATVFNSAQLAPSASNGLYLKTNGTLNSWAAVSATGGGDPFTHPAAGQSATTSLMIFNGNATTTQITSTGSAYLATTDGNVGVGTTSPAAKLSVNAASTGTGFYLAGYANSTGELFKISTSTATATNTAFVIDSTGNVGIGISSPAWPLDVYKASNSFVNVAVTGHSLKMGIVDLYPGIWLDQLTPSNTNYSFQGGSGFTLFNSPDGYIAFRIGNSNRMNVANGISMGQTYYATDPGANDLIIEGDVGIGTTTPAVKLDVNGYIKALQTSTTTACSDNLMGSVFYNQANDKFWGCGSGSSWQQMASSGGSGTVTNIATTYPITGGPITTTGTLSLSGMATTTLTENSLALSLSQPISVIGSSASVLSLATSSLFSYPWTVANGGTGSTTLSGILKGNGTGVVATAVNGTDYTLTTAQSCSNQVITALTAAGGSTCSSVSNAMLSNSTISGVALGGSLFALTNDATLSGSSYDGSGAVSDWGLNLANANTWTGLQTFTYASSTGISTAYASSTLGFFGTLTAGASTLNGVIDAGGATSFEIPNGTPVFNAIGQIGFDTTDSQFLIGTSTVNDPIVIPGIQFLFGGGISSTSPDFISGGRIPTRIQRDGFVVKEIHCNVDGGTSVVINLSNLAGTTDSETVTCDADGQADTSIGTNPTYASGGVQSIEIGTITGAVNYMTYSVYGYWLRE